MNHPHEPSSAATLSAAPSTIAAFIGLGVMGHPMAGHLVAAGHKVRGYNRTGEKAKMWCAQHASVASQHPHASVAVADSPREAVLGADIVLCCVGNDQDLRSIMLGDNGILAGTHPGAIVVDHTTTSATVAREMHAIALQQGVHFIDAPVSGGQAGAQKGQLTIMCGGDANAFAQAQPLLRAYAKAVTHMGDSGAGQLTKMVNQICIAGLLQSLSEAVAFGTRAGLDMHQVLSVIGQGAAQSWQMDNRGRTMVEGQYDFGFAVDWMRKDLGLVLQEAQTNGARLPVTALVDQFYADVQAMGGNRWDTSSLLRRLQPPAEGVKE